MSYLEGDLVEVSVVFEDLDGVDTDPTAVSFIVRPEGGAETTYVYGTDAEVVRDAVGAYHFNLSLTQGGWWYYRWVGTGAVEKTAQGALQALRANPVGA